MPVMNTFAVVAHRVTPTNTRLGTVFSPAQALARLAPGDVALGRLDVLASLDGVEPGLWALERLERDRRHGANGRRTLVAAHDKLTTARALFGAGVPHPRTMHVAPWFRCPSSNRRSSSSRASVLGEDVIRCDDEESIQRTLAYLETRAWFDATGAIAQKLVAPRASTCGWSSPAARSSAR